MDYQRLAVHRTIVAVDVEGFGDRQRTNRNQVVVRDGLYLAMQEAFRQSRIPWTDSNYEDRGDGMFLLVGSEVPKSLFVESLPSALVAALGMHNDSHPDSERIRLRMALHAGEVNYDGHGATAASINLTFRLLESAPVKEALADSPGLLAVITSSWFFEEVVQHSTANPAAYYPAHVTVKETDTTGWICLPDHVNHHSRMAPVHSLGITATTIRPAGARDNLKVRKALSLAYRSAMGEPITPAGDMPVGLEIPTFGEGYVNHRIRVAEVTSSSEPGRESWWTDVPITDNICEFLIARLTASAILSAPVILLGQPGSGKSVLTRIMAARFSGAGFLTVRVELRQAPATADLQDRIEFAIRDATGERMQWSQHIESGNNAPSVVIFDGFDEMLQATGVAQYDFLLRVQAFQEREARLGRPLAVIVTSRIAVADRARIPNGAMAVRLEPFYKEQITEWLRIWVKINLSSFAERDLKPLPVEIALKYEELAEQPLLLLMLALYDADANALQRRPAKLSQTELYGRLLKDFAEREMRKNSPTTSEVDLERAVETELLRLSVAAFAMFNRRSQWVPEADLDVDFSTLLIEGESHATEPARLPTRLTTAQLTIGRFFFVHESQATHENRKLRAYEFLHATFGEFLVARFVVRLLSEMVTSETDSDRLRHGGVDSELLNAVLSFAALTARSSVVVFVGDLLDQLDARQRTAIADALLALHERALFAFSESVYSGYEPLVLPVIARHAAWSANLVFLTVLAAGEVTGTQLFPHEPDPGSAWRNEALIWRSQLVGHGWNGLCQAIALTREWDGERREIRLRRNDGTLIPEVPDVYWFYNVPPNAAARKGVFVSQGQKSVRLQRRIDFSSTMSENTMAHSLAPLASSFPASANVFVVLDGGRAVSATHALLSVLYAPYREGVPDDSVYLILAEVACKIAQDPSVESGNAYLKAALGVLVSAVEQCAAPPISLQPFAGLVSDSITKDTKLTELLVRLDGLLSAHGIIGTASPDD
ncbi:MAG: AAA family ATPase [Streptosporangiaceae bacterium]